MKTILSRVEIARRVDPSRDAADSIVAAKSAIAGAEDIQDRLVARDTGERVPHGSVVA